MISEGLSGSEEEDRLAEEMNEFRKNAAYFNCKTFAIFFLFTLTIGSLAVFITYMAYNKDVILEVFNFKEAGLDADCQASLTKLHKLYYDSVTETSP